MKTLAILLGEHPCIMNILFGPMTVHYREVFLYRIYIAKHYVGRLAHTKTEHVPLSREPPTCHNT